MYDVCFFFFSSRRRHTRFDCDWSSDVCSSDLSWISRGVLQKLDAKPISRVAFSLADGREMERQLTGILLAIDGKKAAVTAAFGEPGEGASLGATAPESWGFLVDPISQKLLPRKLLSLRTKVSMVCQRESLG